MSEYEPEFCRKKVYARPNLNGNSDADFENAARVLLDAARTVENALKGVSMDVFHGRNYQTVENPSFCRELDISLLTQAVDSAYQLRMLANAINDAAKAARNINSFRSMCGLDLK